MNDIGQTPSINPIVAQKTAQSTSTPINTVATVDKTQPADTALINASQNPDTPKEETKPNEAKVNAALDNANAYVQNIQRDLVFSVDKDLDQTVIKVVESESGKVIRQIPEDIFLELAKNLETGGDLNLVNASG